MTDQNLFTTWLDIRFHWPLSLETVLKWEFCWTLKIITAKLTTLRLLSWKTEKTWAGLASLAVCIHTWVWSWSQARVNCNVSGDVLLSFCAVRLYSFSSWYCIPSFSRRTILYTTTQTARSVKHTFQYCDYTRRRHVASSRRLTFHCLDLTRHARQAASSASRIKRSSNRVKTC